MSDDDGLKAMGQVIQIDEARIRDHLGEMVRGTSKRPSTHCWMPKPIDFVVQGVTNAARAGRIPGPAATSVRCTPWRGK